jgi:glycosyltransferase involved in cell wall biosynthesis
MGGAERQVVTLAGRMAERGHTVALLVLRPQLAEEWPTALRVVHLDMRKNPVSLLIALAKGRRFLCDFHPDLLHGHGFHGNLVARFLTLLVPAPLVISTIHNIYEGGWPRMLAYRLTDGLARRTTAVSHAAAHTFVRLKAVPEQKCTVLTNGIDTAGFAPSSTRRARMRAQMGAEGDFVWLTAGRIVPAKDYPNLIAAFARVRAACPEFQLWIAGEAMDKESSGGGISALDAATASSGRVRWLGLRRDMPALLDAADGFVLGSAWEGMPLSVGEAMAMEKPVVATDVGGVRELIADAGLIVPSKDPDALAAAMLSLMRKTAQDRQSLGIAARSRILKNFSMEAKADQWEALYLSELKRKQ